MKEMAIKKIKFIAGAFRFGGIETYIENHKIALKHKQTIVLVYINTAVLLIKMYFQTFLSQWR